ncbi:hypothetical protein MKX03_008234 [Papaver bracteatum]|nr:hypothetical protein MKX03_008234 [Papaver bracteatum]
MCVYLYLKMQISGELAILSLQLKKMQLSWMANTYWAILLYLDLLVKPYLYEVQSSLEELFSTCGEILYMHIPTFPYSAVPWGSVDQVRNP